MYAERGGQPAPDECLDLGWGGPDLPAARADLEHGRAHPLAALGGRERVRRRLRGRVRDHEHLLAAAARLEDEPRPDDAEVEERRDHALLRVLPRRVELFAEGVVPALEEDLDLDRV